MNFIKKINKDWLVSLVTIVIVLIAVFVRTGSSKYDTYVAKKTQAQEAQSMDSSEIELTQAETENDIINGTKDGIVIIIAETANIRSDAGTEYSVVGTGKKGEVFSMTGEKKEASNGRLWYEIFLDDSGEELGWISSKVIDIPDKGMNNS